MMRLFVDGVGLQGPGLPGWRDSVPVLSGTAPYAVAAFAAPKIDVLPPAERRRTSPSVKLVLAVALEAMTNAGRTAGELATVFSSSGGDGETIHAILTTLVTAPLEVSPTKFHNSVHNAPSGYWAVATGSREPSTTLCAHDWSFAVGLVEAAATVVAERRAVALIAHDIAYPEPLNSVRPIEAGFGVALVLAPERTPHTLAGLAIETSGTPVPESAMREPALERLRAGNPAARALPLLSLLARRAPGRVMLETPARGSLTIAVEPAEGVR